MLNPYEYDPPDAVWIWNPRDCTGKIRPWCDGCNQSFGIYGPDTRERVLLVGTTATTGRDDPALTLCYPCGRDWEARNAPAEISCGCPGCRATSAPPTAPDHRTASSLGGRQRAAAQPTPKPVGGLLDALVHLGEQANTSVEDAERSQRAKVQDAEALLKANAHALSRASAEGADARLGMNAEDAEALLLAQGWRSSRVTAEDVEDLLDSPAAFAESMLRVNVESAARLLSGMVEDAEIPGILGFERTKTWPLYTRSDIEDACKPAADALRRSAGLPLPPKPGPSRRPWKRRTELAHRTSEIAREAKDIKDWLTKHLDAGEIDRRALDGIYLCLDWPPYREAQAKRMDPYFVAYRWGTQDLQEADTTSRHLRPVILDAAQSPPSAST